MTEPLRTISYGGDVKLGSLCTGYGGLDMAVGIEPSWVSDIDPGAIKLLEYRYPNVPNLGDLTTVDWSQVEPVDIITAGYPCQPFSAAGKRKGTADGRHIWPHIANALRVLRPRYALFENVAGHVSLGLTDVLADLAEAGFDAEWTTLRASDVGAPHRRERIFILAVDRDTDSRAGNGRRAAVAHLRPDLNESAPTQSSRTDRPPANTASPNRRTRPRHRLGTRASRRITANRQPRNRNGAPTNTTRSQQREPAIRRLRTKPRRSVTRNTAGNPGRIINREPLRTNWGDYTPAVQRWEAVMGRTAPNHTLVINGKDRLDPRFVEWMMGLPPGHVTDVPGLSHSRQLKALGNGVVPQQARAALVELTTRATT